MPFQEITLNTRIRPRSNRRLAWILGVLLMPCSVLADATDPSFDPQAAKEKLHRFAQQLEASSGSLEESERLDPDAAEQRIEEEEEAFEAGAALSQWMICRGDVHGLLQLIDDWSNRLAQRLELTILDAEFVADFGLQPMLLRLAMANAWSQCPRQALTVFDMAIALPSGTHGGKPLLRQALHGLTRAGLALAAGEPVATGEVLQHLQVAKTALPDGFQEIIDAYEHRLQEVLHTRQAPRWRVIPDEEAPRVSRFIRHRCGMQGMATAMIPLWPNEVSLLEARGDHQAAAAWALADLFGLRPRSSIASDSYEPAAVIWRTYGQAATRKALQHAVDHIHIRQVYSEGKLAWITLFGQELVLESGSNDNQTTTWWDQAQIREHFMRSAAWQALWGKDEDLPASGEH